MPFDPVIVPYLVRLYDSHNDDALTALAGFKDVAAARDAVLHALASDNHLTTARAIRVLTEWKYELGVPQVRKLLESKNDLIIRAAVEYIEAMNHEKYTKLLK